MPRGGLVTKVRRHPIRRIGSLLAWVLVGFALYISWPQSLGGDVAYIQVSGHSMDGTYKTGDLIVVRKHDHYSRGDIITYRIPKGTFGAGAQVIHRIIGGDGTKGFTTQGDNKKYPDDWHPRIGDVVGKSWVRLPGAGIWFSRVSKPLPLGVLVGGLTVFVMVLPNKSDRAKLQQEKAAKAAAASVPSPRDAEVADATLEGTSV
jgi:signal peptidase I